MLQMSIAAIMPMGSALALAAVRDKVVADHAQFCVGHGAADGQRKKEFTHTELAQFTGTENLYSHSIAQNVHHTDGMLFVAEKAEAFCLIDEIALAQRSEAALAGEEFQVWKLTVEGTGAIVSCDDGNGRPLLEKRIGYTDFPEPGIKLYFTDGVMMLPVEY